MFIVSFESVLRLSLVLGHLLSLRLRLEIQYTV